MTWPEPDELAQRIERVRRHYVSLLEELPTAVEAPTVWELAERALCWHVMLRDALEPDIDVELLSDAIVVRAEISGTLRHAVLPAPPPFQPMRAIIRFRAGVLAIRLSGRS